MAKHLRLNKSWFDKSLRKTKLVTGQEVYRDRGYIRGVKEFQNKAIWELTFQIDNARCNGSGSITGLLEAIDIIKNLKA